tara:strand:+ start:1285 stop:1539 length:255 start_codon:yes stop_codon:yes gene_type:complete
MTEKDLQTAGTSGYLLAMALYNTSPEMLAVVAQASERQGDLAYWRGKFKHPVLENGLRTIGARGPHAGASLARAIIQDYVERNA